MKGRFGLIHLTVPGHLLEARGVVLLAALNNIFLPTMIACLARPAANESRMMTHKPTGGGLVLREEEESL